VLVAKEVVDDAKRRKKNVLFSKLISKKHMIRSLGSSFLYKLCRLDFHGAWIKWITGCLESSWASLLLNGSPTHSSSVQREYAKVIPWLLFFS